MEGGGAGIDRNGMSMLDVAGKLRLELLRFRSGGQPAGSQRVSYLVDLSLADARLVEWNGANHKSVKRLKIGYWHRWVSARGRRGLVSPLTPALSPPAWPKP